ncbi:DNA polymerase III subunit chi [Gammaproteobacteria bacterium LSUCC0057]|uniref:DNA polymerase III subunit chi n=1 Tax=Gammaproteobacteria bacterium LSUCC0057 TaxID=2559237 RepID=A0A4Y8UMY7_9GAMM|nr:DNA polymerase III subunit chi [Gammaproteobacteria bacterium LSUCC0057]
MTSISFYKVGGDHAAAALLACQLILKASQRDQPVLCLVEREQQAEALSQQLWAVEPHAFVAHGRELHQPVAITTGDQPGDHHGLLLNLCAQTPSWFSRFDRVIELIHSEPHYQQAKRERFAFYQQRGYPLDYHDLSAKFPAASGSASA